MIISESYPYQAGLSVYGKLIAGRAEIIDAARITPSDSLNAVFAQAQEARDKGGNQPISVWLLPMTYKADAGDYSMHGIEIEGMAGTQVEFIGRSPVEIQTPDMAGYPTTRKVKTSVLGPYIRADRYPFCRRFSIRNVEFLGHLGSAAVAGDYIGMCVVGDNVEIDRLTFRHDLSREYDATAGILSAFKGYSKRNFTSFAPIQIGEDRWVEPDVRRLRALKGTRVTNNTFIGEPFDETSGATGVVTGIRMRKCHNSFWRENTFGGFSNPTPLATDIVFTGQPADGELLLFTPWDPYKREFVGDPLYTWVSGTPANAHEIKIGATIPETIRNLGNQLNLNRIDSHGSSFLGAKFPEEVLAAGASAEQMLRVECLTIGAANALAVGNHAVSATSNFFGTALVQKNSANITLRPISDGATRNTSWQWGLVQEDCFGGMVDTTCVSTDRFEAAAYLDVTTMANGDFLFDPGTERGHKIIRGWHGELCRYTDALMDFQHAGWTKIENLAIGQAAFLGSNSGMVRITKGTYWSWTVTQSGLPLDGETIRVTNDGHGGSAIFTYKDTPDPTNPLHVQIGADGLATQKNLRKQIHKKFDDHTIKAFAREPAGSGPWTMEVVFVTWTKRSAVPNMLEAATNTTVADTQNPWSPRWDIVDIHPHALADGATKGVPYLWAESIQQLLTVRLVAHTTREPNEVNTAQATRSVGINAIPVGAEILEVIVDSIHADGTKGAAVTFSLKAGGGVDNATLKFINTTINNTFAKIGAALNLAINTASLVDGRTFASDDTTSLVGGAFALLAVYDGAVGINNNLVTKGTVTTPGGAAVDLQLGNIPSAGNRAGLALANASTQGYKCPIVFKDVNKAYVEIQTEFHTPSNGWGVPSVPIYAEKSDPAVESKIHVRPSSTGTGWGRGRFGSEVFVLLGPNMVLSDVVCPAGSSYAEGRAI